MCNNKEITLPDFNSWGFRVLSNPEGTLSKNISEGLRQAFEQGVALGIRKQEQWWEHQDANTHEHE